MRIIFSKGRNNPLHEAVINNDLSAAKNLASHKQLFFEANNLGFTSYELAQYLQRTEILEILNPNSAEVKIKIQLPDEEEIREFGRKEFFDSFQFNYLKSLHFASYNDLKSTIKKCPTSFQSSFFSREPQRLGRQYQHKFINGHIADISIRWIDNTLGYGVFAESLIDENSFVGEYTGLVRRLSRFKPDPNAYCFHYPTRFLCFKLFVIDALHEGNIMRFVNHSDIPNLTPACMVDRGLTHIAFMTTRKIDKGEQLTIDYGSDYWMKRKKQQL